MMTEQEIEDLHETLAARLRWPLRGVRSFPLVSLLGFLRDTPDRPREDFCRDPRLVEATNAQLVAHIEDLLERGEHLTPVAAPRRRSRS